MARDQLDQISMLIAATQRHSWCPTPLADTATERHSWCLADTAWSDKDHVPSGPPYKSVLHRGACLRQQSLWPNFSFPMVSEFGTFGRSMHRGLGPFGQGRADYPVTTSVWSDHEQGFWSRVRNERWKHTQEMALPVPMTQGVPYYYD